MPLRRTRLTLALTSAALAVTLAACDGSVEIDVAPTPDGSPSETASSTPTPTPSPTPSESPTPTPTPSVSPTLEPVAPAGLTGRLLAAGEVPGFNEQFTWREARTRKTEGTEPFGTCQKFAMTSIGATRVAVREYVPADGTTDSSAGHLVAEFPDDETARRAFEVLRSWRGQCDAELADYDQSEIGAFEPVTAEGEAGWYLLFYGPPENGSLDEAWFDAQGMALVDNRVAVLVLRTIGQDYNYPSGQEPMVAAVERAAGKLS